MFEIFRIQRLQLHQAHMNLTETFGHQATQELNPQKVDISCAKAAQLVLVWLGFSFAYFNKHHENIQERQK